LPVPALPSRASPRRQCLCRQCSFEHAARTLPCVQRRPLTLLALGLEEPFPFRPTADVLCRLAGTDMTAPTLMPATACSRVARNTLLARCASSRLTRLARTALTLPGLGGVPLSAQNASSRTGARPRILSRPVHLGLAHMPETRVFAHPFARLPPRGPVKDPSAPTELGQIPTRQPCDFEPSLTRDASGQLMHSTLSKTSTRTPRGYRLTRGLSVWPSASRRRPRFGRWPSSRVRRC
jgi:hypothetical protein